MSEESPDMTPSSSSSVPTPLPLNQASSPPQVASPRAEGKRKTPRRSGLIQGWQDTKSPALVRSLTPKSVIDFCREAAQEANLPGISPDGNISPELKPALQEWLDKAKVVSSLQQRTGFNYETLYRLATIFHSLARGKKHLDPVDFENGYALVNFFLNYDQYGEKHTSIPLARVTYLSAFQAFDIDRSGTIDIEEFILGIAWLARSQNSPDTPTDEPQLPRSHPVRDGRSIKLAWSSPPRTVLVTKKWGDDEATKALVEVADWVKDERGLNVLLDPNDPDVAAQREHGPLSRFHCLGCRKRCIEGDGGEGVRMVMGDGKQVMLTDPDEYDCEPVMVDLVICLGGDGTVLRTIMWLETDNLYRRGNIVSLMPPPVVAFALGSLGFLTPHSFEKYRELLNKVFDAPIENVLKADDEAKSKVFCTMRSRLRCEVISKIRKSPDGSPVDASDVPEGTDGVIEKVILQQQVLNECVIARGAKAALQRFDFIVDGKYVTQFQGDGLIICTPSGSSAYSMAAGGSLVAPNVPCIMITPIAPHGLNQRPLVLPASASIEIEIGRFLTMPPRIFQPHHESAFVMMVHDKKDILFSRIDNDVTVAGKDKEWEDLLSEVNEAFSLELTRAQLESKWKNLKTRCRRYVSAIRASREKTGGGPAPPVDDTMERVWDVLGRQNPTLVKVTNPRTTSGRSSPSALPKKISTGEVPMEVGDIKPTPSSPSAVEAAAAAFVLGDTSHEDVDKHEEPPPPTPRAAENSPKSSSHGKIAPAGTTIRRTTTTNQAQTTTTSAYIKKLDCETDLAKEIHDRKLNLVEEKRLAAVAKRVAQQAKAEYYTAKKKKILALEEPSS